MGSCPGTKPLTSAGPGSGSRRPEGALWWGLRTWAAWSVELEARGLMCHSDPLWYLSAKKPHEGQGNKPQWAFLLGLFLCHLRDALVPGLLHSCSLIVSLLPWFF